MEDTINVTDVMRRSTARYSERSPQIIMDTNMFKYRLTNPPKNIVVTSGVIGELEKHREVFPQENVAQLFRAFNPRIVTPFISEENEALILRASLKNPKAAYRQAIGIGWVDTQQISYGIECATNGNQALLISNDGDIITTVEALREMRKDLANNLHATSLRRYLKSKHETPSLNEPYWKNSFFRLVEHGYRATA